MRDNIFRCDEDVKLDESLLLHEFVLSRMSVRPQAVAITDGSTGRSLTFGQVASMIRSVAVGLSSLGIGGGDVVMLLLPNVPEYVALFHGIIAAGAVVTTANPAYTQAEVAKQAADSGTRVVVTARHLLEKARGIGPEPVILVSIGDDLPAGVIPAGKLLEAGTTGGALRRVGAGRGDTCVLPYSSGTTGRPKGVMLTHSCLLANAQQQIEGDCPRMDLREGDVVLGLLPMFHIYGVLVLNVLAPCVGARVITMPAFDMELMLRIVERERVTVAPLVPPIILALTKLPLVSKFDLSSLRAIISGAAPLDAKLHLACQQRLPHCIVAQGYGMTESSPTLTLSRALRAPTQGMPKLSTGVPGSAGSLLPLTEAKVVDLQTGRSLGPGETGEIWARGPQVMKGYLHDEAATAETLLPGGWLRTGDIGYFDSRGELFLLDRAKELIKVKGFQVPPAELEGMLLSHPNIADAAVVPAPDPRAWEVPVAFVVLRPGGGPTSEADVLEFVAGQVAPYKRLRSVRFVESIPKTPSGKILRRELRARL